MGLLGTAAQVAVASHVHGKVKRRRSQRWAAQDAVTAAQAPPPQAASGCTAPPPPGPDETLARLAQLGELRASGVLAEVEFQAQKARIIGP